MRIRTTLAVASCVVALSLGSASCGGGSSNTSQGAPFDPATAFLQRCATCHGADGQGAVGPQLNHGAVLRKYPNIEDQIAVVTNGRGGMPSFGSSLTAAQIRAVVEYTRGL